MWTKIGTNVDTIVEVGTISAYLSLSEGGFWPKLSKVGIIGSGFGPTLSNMGIIEGGFGTTFCKVDVIGRQN